MKITTIMRTALFLALLIFVSSAVCYGQVANREIEAVRNKALLLDTDLTLIDSYVTEQFAELAAAADGTAVYSPQQNLLANAQSTTARNSQTARTYADRYSRNVAMQLSRILEQTSQADENPTQRSIRTAAVVIAAQMDNDQLITPLVALIDDPIFEVRYWAIKGLSGPRTSQALRQVGETTSETVLDALVSALDQAQTGAMIDTIFQALAPFAYKEKGRQALITGIDKRLGQYQNWSVTDEGVDLRLIGRLVQYATESVSVSALEARNALLAKAVDLYVTASQRYTMGMQAKDSKGKTLVVLDQQSQDRLTRLLSEGEVLFLTVADSDRRPRIRNCIQREKYDDLDETIVSLFKYDGVINRALNLYEPDAASSKDALPTDALTPVPAEKIAYAESMRDVSGQLVME